MKVFFILFLVSFFSIAVTAQNGFQFKDNKTKATLPFEFVNNLIIIPLNVNGVTLNFLLDTGVSETLIFSLDESHGVSFTQSQSVNMKGFGNKADFVAYKYMNNTISFKNYIDTKHIIYLVLDQEINISSQVGMNVNGIIGYHFFKNNLVKINYNSKKITIIKPSLKRLQNIDKQYSKIALEIDNNKPYLNCFTILDNYAPPIPSKLLLDTGNSDALWLFKDKDVRIKLPNTFINDYLGRGLNGDVYGQRARIKSVQILNYSIQKPIVSFIDSLTTSAIMLSENRIGSLGSEIIKRFNIIFDYKMNALYFKKNTLFASLFEFNKSGIDVQHQGLQWAVEPYALNPTLNPIVFDKNGERVQNSLNFKFKLQPIFVISHIRDNSPAHIAGLLKDDVLITINNVTAGNFKLQDIVELLKGDEDKVVNLEIDRKGVLLKFKFKLKSIL